MQQKKRHEHLARILGGLGQELKDSGHTELKEHGQTQTPTNQLKVNFPRLKFKIGEQVYDLEPVKLDRKTQTAFKSKNTP